MTLRNQILKLLAMRDHSVYELKTKLRRKEPFCNDEFMAAIEDLKMKGYLPNEETLAQRIALSLQRRGRGENRIRMDLKKRGLSTKVKLDQNTEIQSAMNVLRKIKSTTPDKEKWARKLINRGFTPYVVSKVLNQPFEDFSESYDV